MKHIIISLFATFSAFAAPALAHEGEGHVQLQVAPATPAQAGKPYEGTLTLTLADGKPATPEALQVVHTERLHLLVIDPTLSDYHHLHPKPGTKPGEYVLNFVPRRDGAYRLWADVTPVGGEHAYARADIGRYSTDATIDRSETREAQVDGLTFRLTLATPLSAGQATMATVEVSKEGKPFAALEPVMGAYAHGVGFSDDGQQLLHVHPLGEEPTGDQRGGPTLQFHLLPAEPGFLKFFVQVRVDGRDVFAPFGLFVPR